MTAADDPYTATARDHGIDRAAVSDTSDTSPTRNGAPPPDDRDDPRGVAAARRVRLTRASGIKPRPVRWIWDGHIPQGEICLTPGRGGIGKSTFHAWLIARLTKGRLPGVHHGTPKPCVIAAVEDSWSRTIVPRLMAAGADLEMVYRAEVVTQDDEQLTLTLPADIDTLEAEAVRVGAALVSVDPLMSAMSSGLDTHKDRDVRQALEPLAQLADRTGCAVLGNAHFRKGIAADPLMMAMGSAAFGNVVRAALGFARDTDDDQPLDDGSCVISQIKNNLGRMDMPSRRYRIKSTTLDTDEGPTDVGHLEMLGATDRNVSAIFNGAGKSESALGDAEDWLLSYLRDRQDREAPRKDIVKAA